MTEITKNKSENYDFSHLAKLHPCLGGEAHSNFGRIHLYWIQETMKMVTMTKIRRRIFPHIFPYHLLSQSQTMVPNQKDEEQVEICKQCRNSSQAIYTQHMFFTSVIISYKYLYFYRLCCCLVTASLVLVVLKQ